jgi:hypothetical protein
VAETGAEALTKVAFVEDRVFKLRGSPVVAGSAQLKPHVDFLLTRVGQCKSKLNDLAAANASNPASPAPVAASVSPAPVLVSSGAAEVTATGPALQEVKVDASPQLSRASDLEEVPPPVKLEPPRLDDRKSRSHLERRSGAVFDNASSPAARTAGAGAVPPIAIGQLAGRPVTAMEVLSPNSKTTPIKSPRGLEKVGATPLMKISNSPPRVPDSPAARRIGGSAITPKEHQQRTEREAVIASLGPAPVGPPLSGLGSPPSQGDAQSLRKSVSEFDKLISRVRGDSVGSDESLPAAAVSVSADDRTNWKAEHDKMAQKFEAARQLILKLQEKNRRLELQAGQVPQLLRQLSELEGRTQKLSVVKTHYEEKIPQLNARIIELENELFVLRNSRSSLAENVFFVGERVWVHVRELWHEATVTERTVDNAYVVRLESSGEVAVLGRDSVRKITVDGLESMPLVASGGISATGESDDSLEAEVAAVTGNPRRSREAAGSPSPTSNASVAPIPVAEKSATTPSKGMDSLLSSTKQNMKTLFGGGRRKNNDSSLAPLGSSSAGSSAVSSTASSPGQPVKAHDKLRSLFHNNRASVVVRPNSNGLDEASSGAEEIPPDAVGLGDLQRIYVSDLWSALMDPASSETLFEVFFTTYEYHCTWEQIFATLSAIYNESAGLEPEALERRVQALKLLQKWVQYSPDVLKAKSTTAEFVKGFTFADPGSLASGQAEDAESLQARGKFVVGDYGTVASKTSAAGQGPPTLSVLGSSSSVITPIKPRDGVRSPAARGTAKKNPSSTNSLQGTVGTPKSPRLRSKTEASSPTTSPRPSASDVATGDELSLRGDEDLSDLSDDEEVTFEQDDESDLRARKKGHALFKSIGALYKSLNMDTQSLQRAFVSGTTGGSTTATPGEGTVGESETEDSAASLTDSSKQLSFMDALTSWVESANVSNDKANPEAEKLMQAMGGWRRGGPSRRKSKSVVAKKLVHQKKGNLSSVRDAANVNILGFSPYAVAKQLFLEEWELFNAIKPLEFRRLRFMDAKSGHSFQYMVHRFNTWCSWIATEVLNRPSSLERANVIEFFIEVASECNKFHNFNSAYAIIGALNQPSVARLKFSWSRVAKKSMRNYNRVLAFWSTSHNMGNYRAELKKIKPPAVPYLGLIGKDLFQTEMGAPTVLSLKTDEEWVLNFFKLRSLAQQFRFISSLQQLADAPDWEPNMDLATCISAVTPLSDDEAYERSLKLEPRKITQSELYMLEHGPSVSAPPPAILSPSSEDSSAESKEAAPPSPRASQAAVGQLLKVRPDLSSYKLGSPELEKFVKGETTSVAAMELLASVASVASKAPEFASGGSNKRGAFAIAALVTWLVRELALLEKASKFDMEAAETAKSYAMKVVEGMRSAGFIVPAKKWAAKLQGTLHKGGFQGFGLKADDQSMWAVDLDELDRRSAK